jgi:hypothetical protein
VLGQLEGVLGVLRAHLSERPVTDHSDDLYRLVQGIRFVLGGGTPSHGLDLYSELGCVENPLF